MKLSIIIPVFNEAENIEKVIYEARRAPVKIAKEIIIVDDGSRDQTRLKLKKYLQDKDLKIIFQKQNMGKGWAIRRGLEVVDGDIVLIQDADLEYSVGDYPALLEPILKNKADIVYGSRFKGQIKNMRWPNFLANKILTLTANWLYGLKITDEATAYKVFKTEVIKKIPLKCRGFEFCPEITAKAAKRGYKFQEVPITYHARDAKAGKKIKYQDGFLALWTLIKYRFKD